MKKVYLSKFEQHDTECFCGTADARILARMSQAESDDERTRYQRALRPAKVREISGYVQGSQGLLPGSVILGTCFEDKVVVKELSIPGKTGMEPLYYVELPETETELMEFQGTLDVMDGQHRLASFTEEHVRIEDEVTYQLAFNLYITPTIELKRILFIAANEKQERVSSNLLQWYRAELGRLGSLEQEYLNIIRHLNEDDDSPLCGRVIMGDEVLPKGYKALQLIRVLQKSKVFEIRVGTEALTIDDLVSMIKVYLSGWESACDVSFREPLVGDTTTKISAIRYMMTILPTIFSLSVGERATFTAEFVEEKLSTLAEAIGVEKMVQLFRSRDLNYAFRGEGATMKLAETHVEKLKTYELQGRYRHAFNPLRKP